MLQRARKRDFKSFKDVTQSYMDPKIGKAHSTLQCTLHRALQYTLQRTLQCTFRFTLQAILQFTLQCTLQLGVPAGRPGNQTVGEHLKL